jgi:hypothetical protein
MVSNGLSCGCAEHAHMCHHCSTSYGMSVHAYIFDDLRSRRQFPLRLSCGSDDSDRPQRLITPCERARGAERSGRGRCVMCDVNVDARMHTCRQTTDSRLKQIRVDIILAGARVGKCIRGGDSRTCLARTRLDAQTAWDRRPPGHFSLRDFSHGRSCFSFQFIFESWPDRVLFQRPHPQ